MAANRIKIKSRTVNLYSPEKRDRKIKLYGALYAAGVTEDFEESADLILNRRVLLNDRVCVYPEYVVQPQDKITVIGRRVKIIIR